MCLAGDRLVKGFLLIARHINPVVVNPGIRVLDVDAPVALLPYDVGTHVFAAVVVVAAAASDHVLVGTRVDHR